jgi:hypothetical protein
MTKDYTYKEFKYLFDFFLKDNEDISNVCAFHYMKGKSTFRHQLSFPDSILPGIHQLQFENVPLGFDNNLRTGTWLEEQDLYFFNATNPERKGRQLELDQGLKADILFLKFVRGRHVYAFFLQYNKDALSYSIGNINSFKDISEDQKKYFVKYKQGLFSKMLQSNAKGALDMFIEKEKEVEENENNNSVDSIYDYLKSVDQKHSKELDLIAANHLKFASDVLEELANKKGYHATFNNEAIKHISNLHLDISSFYNAIKFAFEYCCKIHESKGLSGQVIVGKEFLQGIGEFGEVDNKPMKIDEDVIDMMTYNKIKNYLLDIEKHAALLEERNSKVNGKNIAQSLGKSSSGFTQYFYKYANYIQSVYTADPSQFPIITKYELDTLKNVLAKAGLEIVKKSS